MFEANSIIKASAGTGKTFALATRFIRLMLFDGVKPETIVALTFSRAAAQEIYAKILGRLCDAAADEDGAAREWENLLDDFRTGQVPDGAAKLAAICAKPPNHAAADFRALLRRLADAQHQGSIATLDSFILRIVRYFPREMGFQNAVSVLDPIDESAAIDDAVRRTLSRTDDSVRGLATAFARATGGEHVRQCLGVIGGILGRQGWRDFVLTHPECETWSVEGMCRALGVETASICPDLSVLPFNDLGRKGAVSPEETFVRYAGAYDGTTGLLDTTESVKALMLHFREHPEATSYDYSFYRKPYTFACGAEGAAVIRAAIRHMANLYLRRQLEIVRAKIDLVLAIEAEYGRMTRRAGKLTFADFTKFSAEEEFSTRGIALRNVEFRFDAKFDHWALDEFQDTSELQWRCLRELVRNAAEEGCNGESRTAMVVGDMKQSIYAWRGASARPFEEVAGWRAFEGCSRDFRLSHRYGPAIAELVNRIFGPQNITTAGIVPRACASAVEAWRNGWLDHVSHEAQDYVKVIAAKGDGDDDSGEADVLAALHAELDALWRRHESAKSTDTVGVLVRNNDKGLTVAEYLRAHGLPVVWEGMCPVDDVPVVQAVLALLKLADHPADTTAWRTVNELVAIRPVLLPTATDPAAASEAVSQCVTRQGLARTLKEFCGRLLDGGKLPPDGLTCARLRQLVELGVAFEMRETGCGRIDAFLSFVAQSGKRELATSSDVIRILTIHRSKGLGMDHVMVPLFEGSRASSAVDAPKSSSPLYAGGPWVLSHLKKGCERFNDETYAAFEAMRSGRFAEALRTYYVALTRAKKSMYVIFPDDSDPQDYGKGLLMRDLIVNAVGGALPYEAGRPPAFASRHGRAVASEPWPSEGRRRTVVRVSPSHGMQKTARNMSAAALFGEEFGAAARQGVDIHAAYQTVEWADAAMAEKLPPAFREAFVKPSPEATVWRERAYETVVGAYWESGQFDRVVFRTVDGVRMATIYDFKTNARRQGETEESFARRLCGQYAAQMAAYRRALGRMTGIPLDRITTKLLLEATGQSVSCEGGADGGVADGG